MEKYFTFSLGGLCFIDSLSFSFTLSATPKESFKVTAEISKGSDLLYKKGTYPYKYMHSWEIKDLERQVCQKRMTFTASLMTRT